MKIWITDDLALDTETMSDGSVMEIDIMDAQQHGVYLNKKQVQALADACNAWLGKQPWVDEQGRQLTWVDIDWSSSKK